MENRSSKSTEQDAQDAFAPVLNNPLFTWPVDLLAIWRWYRQAWDIPSELLICGLLAIVSFFYFQPVINAEDGGLIPNVIGVMFIRNFIYTCVIAGSLHLYFYRWKAQGGQDKYEKSFLHRPSPRFIFGHQIYDNMFWTLASGVTLWTAYEVIILSWQALHPGLFLAFSDAPIWFMILFLLIVLFESAHFYFVHRLLHTRLFYKYFHSVHHRNVNTGPWSGISMHPVEHAVYFSSILIHLVIPSHPIHVFFHMYIITLSPIAGHCGFERLIAAGRGRIMLGHYHHHLHHRYFDCNYGTSELPWDVWFGSFHDGTEKGHKIMKSRLQQHKKETM